MIFVQICLDLLIRLIRILQLRFSFVHLFGPQVPVLEVLLLEDLAASLVVVAQVLAAVSLEAARLVQAAADCLVAVAALQAWSWRHRRNSESQKKGTFNLLRVSVCAQGGVGGSHVERESAWVKGL